MIAVNGAAAAAVVVAVGMKPETANASVETEASARTARRQDRTVAIAMSARPGVTDVNPMNRAGISAMRAVASRQARQKSRADRKRRPRKCARSSQRSRPWKPVRSRVVKKARDVDAAAEDAADAVDAKAGKTAAVLDSKTLCP